MSPVGDLPVLRDLRESWQRSSLAGVSTSLAAAPIELDEAGLFVTRERSDWVSLAETVLTPQLEVVQDTGHVLTLFDAAGRMLRSAGDPFVLARLNDIHFIPGSNWSEATAGTNGPGTALAVGRPVHVVGAEHYCEAWHPWHCAAVPLHNPAGDVIGVLDVSGPAQRAAPQVLQLARLLGVTVEQALLARAFRRQTVVLARYSELTARYPTDALFALDAEGRVLHANGAAQARGLPARVKVPGGTSFTASSAQQLPWLESASLFPVLEAGTRVGTCVLLRDDRKAPRRAPRPSTRYRFEDLVGHGLHASVALARSASATHMPVLLLGESGVGKEVFAQAIHAESPRREGPFVAVNCAALSRELVESELFGYVGGAFSGARSEGAVGRFEAANGGTLFLDEVGDLPLPAQAALLRALQERQVTPVGSSQGRAVDVRVVSATNHPLDESVRRGTFRLDLFHRLNVIAIAVPPLRERMGDLAPLLEHLSAAIEAETGLRVVVPAELRAVMGRHAWPGNVRELENVLRRLAVLGRDREVTVADLPFFSAAAPPGGVDLQVQRLLDVIHSARNMAEAAAKLGINRSTLYRQLERLGLKPGRTANPGA